MMRNRKHVFTILLLAMSFVLVLGLGASVFAADEGSASTGKGYTYRVTIYSGNQGVFEGGKHVWKNEYHAGDMASISTEDLGFRIKDDKYYCRGFRVTGHDNDETTGIQRLQIDNIDTDVSYELAYGIKGAMVSYIVNYVDENGKTLHASDTYYGMPGDKPVVSYRYIDGYYPNAYNMGKTLVEDETKNVFTFTYTKGTPPGGGTTVVRQPGAAAPGTAANPAGTAAPGQDGNNTGAGVDIEDNDTPLAGPQQYVDLDENDTPLAGGNFGKNRSSLPILIGSCIIVLAGIIVILLLLRRRRRKQEEECAEAAEAQATA